MRSTPQAERDVAATTILRIRGEFAEMPGLSLTPAQASRLFGISPDTCAGIFTHLIEEGMLRLKLDGRYARSEDTSC